MTVGVKVISAADIARCPKASLGPRHYRDDGTCYCDEAPGRVAALTEQINGMLHDVSVLRRERQAWMDRS
jgi:hypothetical protein